MLLPSRGIRRLVFSGVASTLLRNGREWKPELGCSGANPGVVRAERPRLATLGGSEMERVQGAERHAWVADIEDRAGSLHEARGDRHEAQAPRGHVCGDLPPRSPTMHAIDRPLALLAKQGREALDQHKMRRPRRAAIRERGIEVAVGLAHEELDQDRRIEVHAVRPQSRASRSPRTRTSARGAFFGRPRSKARLTRNGGGALMPNPTSLALGRPPDVMTTSSPAAARSRSSDRRALATRTLAIMP